ncbi:MAG: helix-turn-helix domain-containing protein [Elusimicrobiota bacterium]|jgi:predicted transcriptional regulator|nr:helix-turn-helix domain-containing protein [Elusimicrobiota bacterium]
MQSALIGEMIKVRKAKHLSQSNCKTNSNINQTIIDRIEKGLSDPQISTVLKYLVPLGKTLAIVPIRKRKVG